MENGVYARSFARAAELLGGVDKLAAQLNVPQSYLKLWMKGADKPPVDVFLRVVDFLMEQKTSTSGGVSPNILEASSTPNSVTGSTCSVTNPKPLLSSISDRQKGNQGT